MRKSSTRIRHQLALAHRLLVAQDVLEAFGHVSVREAANPDVFLLPQACPPSRVCARDILEFDLDGGHIGNGDEPLFSERFIHAAIYRARPDVHAVCHHHSPSIMPFCVAGRVLEPVSQTGAAMGRMVPIWDSQTEFGDTLLLVNSGEQAASLARALGDGWMVLMRHHGATVAGRSLEEMVFRAVHSCRDADYQLHASLLGAASPLSERERELAGQVRAAAINRSWAHWEALLPDALRLEDPILDQDEIE